MGERKKNPYTRADYKERAARAGEDEEEEEAAAVCCCVACVSRALYHVYNIMRDTLCLYYIMYR